MARFYDIVIDTREQQPLTGWGGDVRQHKMMLYTGDYSLLQYRDLICVERKGKADWLGTLAGYANDMVNGRFAKELRRMQTFRYRAIIVECDYAKLLAGDYPKELKKAYVHSGMHPASVMALAASISVKYQVNILYMPDREHTQHWVEAHLKTFARMMEAEEQAMGLDEL